jgi:hypothetical protein
MWADAVLPPMFDSEFIGATNLRFGLDKTDSRYIISLISMARVSDLGVMTSESSVDDTWSVVYPQSSISSSSMVSLSRSMCELVRISLAASVLSCTNVLLLESDDFFF